MLGPQDTRSFLEDYLDIIRKSIGFVLRRVAANLVWFILIALLFSAVGVALWYQQAPYYESDLVVMYNSKTMPRKTYGEMVHKLDLLAQSGSGEELARELQLSPDLGKSILRLEAKNRSGSPLHEDITEEYQAIYITLKATNRAAFAAVEKGLVAYLGSSPYQQRISKMAVERIGTKMEMLNTDLRKTDSIIEAYTIALRNGVPLQDSVGERYNIQVLFDHKSALEDNLLNQKLTSELEGGPTVTVSHGFAPADRPGRGSKKPTMALTIIGIAVALGWVILKKEKKTISA